MTACFYSMFSLSVAFGTAVFSFIAIVVASNAGGLSCLGEYQLCTKDSIGVCAFTVDDCQQKYCTQPGQYVCPISKACVNSAEDYVQCPMLKNTHLDWTLSIDERIDFLLSNLSLNEKYPQLTNEAPSIDRLGIPFYNWRSNDMHSVKLPDSTVFPDGVGLGATFSKQHVRKLAHIIGMEARALHNSFVDQGNRVGYRNDGGAITTNSPNINLVRDPRWGRAQEVYSEDPLLTGHLAYEFVSGLQYGGAQNDTYLLMGAQCKHFAVYDLENLPESRLSYNAVTNAVNFAETYSPAFYECVVRAQAAQVMCAYNSVNGVPACCQGDLLNTVLRDQWQFQGLVVSDYDAMEWAYSIHHYVNSSEAALAAALTNGCDQEGGGTSAIDTIPSAINDGLITMNDIDRALARLLRVRIKLGMFDPPTFVQYNYLYNSSSTVQSPQHLAYAREVAQKSIVLFKNANNVLPLNAAELNTKKQSIAVIGPQFIGTDLLLGNDAAYPSKGVATILQALRSAINESYEMKCKSEPNVFYAGSNGNAFNGSTTFTEAECASLCYQDDECQFYSFLTTLTNFDCGNAGYLSNCFLRNTSDGYTVNVSDWNSGACLTKNTSQSQIHNALGCQSVLCANDTAFESALDLIQSMHESQNLHAVMIGLGLNQTVEAEARDRESIELPGHQTDLVQFVYNFTSAQTPKIPIICVLIHGGTVALGSAYAQCDAILDAWYPAQMGGYAVADVVFGVANPSGRAPVTSYLSTDDLPPPGQQDLYAGNGTTYRYFKGDVLFPFGFGLSYTQFAYSNLTTNVSATGENVIIHDPCEVVLVTFTVKNVGNVDGDEVVQLYVEQPDGTVPRPLVRLADFERVENIKVDEERSVSLMLTPRYRSVVYNQDDTEQWYKPDIVIEAISITIFVGGGQPRYFKGGLSMTLNVTTSASFYDCDIQY